MSEGDDMSERILRTIENVLQTDFEIQEFTILPTEDNNKNKSPVLYVQHNVALESWCVKHVYRYACRNIFERRDLKKLPYDKLSNINYLLVGAILINPDVCTFWNIKRELTALNVLGLDKELYFSQIVLTRDSKCNEAFSYRRHLLKQVINKLSWDDDLQIVMNYLENELRVVHIASDKAANNYHSWNHRIWCMENIASASQNMWNIVYSELNYSQEWVNNHVSEHSGYHYRQYLFKLIKNHKNVASRLDSFHDFLMKHLNLIDDGERCNVISYLLGKRKKGKLIEESYSQINYVSILLYDLFILIDKLNAVFPDHESLFYHRRFVVYHLVKFVYEHHDLEFPPKTKFAQSLLPSSLNLVNSDFKSTVKPNEFNKVKAKAEDSVLYKMVLDSEKSYIRKEGNSVSLVQNELIKRYQKWLKYVISFE